MANAIEDFVKRLDYCYEIEKTNLKNHPLALMIPRNLVTKIIGIGGCIIKELSQKSGGANIRIHSDKDIDIDINEIVVTVEGSIEQKKSAAILITYQIKLYKNGGFVSIT